MFQCRHDIIIKWPENNPLTVLDMQWLFINIICLNK